MSVEKVGTRIPTNYIWGGTLYYNSVGGGGDNGCYYYLIYNPYEDKIITVGPTSSYSIPSKVVEGFLDSWAYKSFEFARNPISKAVDVSDLQSKIINALKPWVLIALGLGLAFLVVRFGPQIMIRLFLPFAVLGALGRIGRSNKDE